MKARSLLAVAFSVLMTGASVAADLEAYPQAYRGGALPYKPFDWTGLYFGVNVGYARAHGTARLEFIGPPLDGVVVNDSASPTGGLAGGQVGFNWHLRPLVFGFELDGQWAELKDTFTVGCGTRCLLTETVTLRSLITGRGRIGFAFDTMMVYATVGGALVNARADLSAVIGTTSAGFLPLSNNTAGGVAGIGFEAAFWEGWSAKVEYLYVSTNSRGATGQPPLGIESWDTGYVQNIVRAGLNYRFGPTY